MSSNDEISDELESTFVPYLLEVMRLSRTDSSTELLSVDTAEDWIRLVVRDRADEMA
jgi:hypothetical protein